MNNFPSYKVVSTDKLVPYVNNSRTHTPEQVDQIAASIREFGFTNPVLVDEQGSVIAGHGRLLAAHKLGITEVPSIELVDLTENQKKAYILADNKLALNAGWDIELLSIEFDELSKAGYDLALTGFDTDEIESFIMPDFPPGSEDEQGRLDQLEPKLVTCPGCAREFDARGQV